MDQREDAYNAGVAWNKSKERPAATGTSQVLEAAAQKLEERARGNFLIGQFELQDECIRCAATIRHMKDWYKLPEGEAK